MDDSIVGPVLADGTFDDEPWELRGRIREDHGVYGVRTAVTETEIYARLPHDRSGGKPLGHFGTHDVGGGEIPAGDGGKPRSIKYVAGVVDASVDGVHVLTSDGHTVPAQLAGDDPRARFFIALVPSAWRVQWVVAVNDEGTELERRSLARL